MSKRCYTDEEIDEYKMSMHRKINNTSNDTSLSKKEQSDRMKNLRIEMHKTIAKMMETQMEKTDDEEISKLQSILQIEQEKTKHEQEKTKQLELEYKILKVKKKMKII